jgi:arylsulfatase A-like enzyme/glycosyltransferase involved in cell wall biosynthesis
MSVPHLTVLICTHDRADLLAKVLASLNQARRPPDWKVEILVVANACSDATHALLEDYPRQAEGQGWLPLRWLAEPTPGKSHALNRGAAQLTEGWVAIVDDDHRVAEDFLVEIAGAVAAHPQATMLCGRILPDWDGSEPAWVHDPGPYRIYPLPIPRQDFGEASRELGLDGPIPGGGNQILRVEVLQRVGRFSTELGPQGHDLGGGEDTEYMLRALRQGERLVYEPRIVQYHYVDKTRLRLGYLMKKAFQRSQASVRFSRHAGRGVPPYAWRKLLGYGAQTVFSTSWAKTRFYLVRCAASLGEISAMRTGGRGDGLRRRLAADEPHWPAWLTLAALLGALALWWRGGMLGTALAHALVPPAVAAVASLGLLARSVATFSRTGPNLKAEVLRHYARYTLLALLRLTFWAWVLFTLMGGLGALAYLCLTVIARTDATFPGLALASALGIIGVTGLQFCRHLLFLPASICASLNILPSRLYGLWQRLSPLRLQALLALTLGGLAALVLLAILRLLADGRQHEALSLWCGVLAYGGVYRWATWRPDTTPLPAPRRRGGPPNILMLGSDTLRADRLGALGYGRGLTPHLDGLAARGALFSQCYVPCARTAPSLLSLLTGMWPHHHGVRDNFIADKDTDLRVPDLPELLRQHGYATAAVSDWCGADLKKFSLGFDYVDAPDDQWNIKYLLRQGPKDLRLILSLFTHNRFGKTWLPELYYLAGVPMTSELGRQGRRVLNALAQGDQPFLLHMFYSTTHPPFGVEYPYYTRLARPDYRGESKFVMARLTEPFEIIRRQGQPREEFDLDQILDLYDSCVLRFDDEVGQMLAHLDALGLADDTLVVIYSDHGMEFFEHNTWGQGNSAIGDFSPRVPLLLAGPGIPVGLRGEVVRSIDLLPTLLQCAGIEPPRHLDGASLLPLLQGKAEAPRAAFNETGIWIADIPGLPADHLRYPNLLELLEVPDKDSGTLAIKPEYVQITLLAKDRMMRQGRWKLVYQPLTKGYVLRLFDTETDPNCEHDLSQQEPEVRAQLWGQLKAWMDQDPWLAQAPGRNDTRGC